MKLYACLLAVVFWAAPPTSAGEITAEGAEDRLIVQFNAGLSMADGRKVIEALGLELIDEIRALKLGLVQAKPGRSAAAIQGLRAHPAIGRVERDVWRNWIDAAPASLQEVPFPSIRAALETLAPPVLPKASDEAQWGVKRVNAPAAWPTNGGDGVKVAIVDTGIDPNHPELQGQIAGGYNALAKDQPWADDHFHGTHVAGIVAAKLNGTGVVGVAPNAKLYAVKVLTKEGSGSLFGIMGGIVWCAQNGIQVLNMSLGAPQEMPFLQYALQMAVNAGATVVAAAGNDGKAVNWPAAYPEAIAVSALCPPGVANAKLCTSANEGIAAFSSRGPEIDFIAPGVLIPSTVPASHDASGIKAYSGTSMACPHVAGLAALAAARGAQGAGAVKAALAAAATPLSGHSAGEQGAGLVDAAKLSR